MKNPQINFFCTRDDILGLMREVSEDGCSIFRVGHFRELAESGPYSIQALPEFGICTAGQQALCPAYLLLPAGSSPLGRKVGLATSEEKWAVDVAAAPGSVYLRPGGEFETDVLIAGALSADPGSAWSADLFKSLKRTMSADFVRVRSYWLGPQANAVLNRGGRLTANVRSPQQYDLRA